MPNVQSQLVAKGVDFPNAFVVNPECCPSRSTILTGEYSHTTGVYSNKPPDGGFPAFEPDEGSTLATWLHDAGYHTGLVGKYLNGYEDTDVGHVPPGWDDWVALTHGTAENGPGGYYDYTLSVGSSSSGGKPETHGKGQRNYSTDVLGKRAVQFVDEAPANQPLFLYFAPYAPHGPIQVARKYRKACADLTWTNPPSFNAGSSPKGPEPAYQAKQPPLTQKDLRKIDRRHFQDCRSLQSVDQWVGRIMDALRATNRLQDSMIVFMSDNGYLLGEHRRIGKVVPYDESIRVPMVVRYDPVTASHAGTTNPDMVLNLDIAPTFADAAGVSTPPERERAQHAADPVRSRCEVARPLPDRTWAGRRAGLLRGPDDGLEVRAVRDRRGGAVPPHGERGGRRRTLRAGQPGGESEAAVPERTRPVARDRAADVPAPAAGRAADALIWPGPRIVSAGT